MLENCNLCPHRCGVNRIKGEIGRCKCTNNVKIALASLFHYEEPCISGKSGSGAVFFSNCNLNCVYCQNYKISQLGSGKEFSINELAEIFLDLQNQGAENINLVTPTAYVYHIIEALDIAKSKGLFLPIIYNTNGYENVETINLLNGYVDVYLPDFKYYDNAIARKYSNINNYFEITSNAILEMYYQVGLPKFDDNGMIKKGLIIRHLILPNHIENSKNVLLWIKENLPRAIYVSIMAQYFPTYKAKDIALLNRKLNLDELLEIKEYFETLNLENGYIQDLEDNELKYVPNF